MISINGLDMAGAAPSRGLGGFRLASRAAAKCLGRFVDGDDVDHAVGLIDPTGHFDLFAGELRGLFLIVQLVDGLGGGIVEDERGVRLDASQRAGFIAGGIGLESTLPLHHFVRTGFGAGTIHHLAGDGLLVLSCEPKHRE